ncbi:MAG: 4Fe-4S dicluster domain-containing protein [Bacteroidetes bacterium]|nr:MAG: 4Fe-4S dicluster domain-containing protein [Bacteroidota bacterium]
MDGKYFHHALKFRKDVCIGCSHCMNVCPTQAIRIRAGKAELKDNFCVDCGKCYRACPVGAIIVEQDDFNQIFRYKQRVALIPSILLGQFPDEVSLTQVSSVLMELGFTHVYEVEHGVEVLKNTMKNHVETHQEARPLISTFCPAIVRLIQVRFPTLTDNLILLKPPLDIAAAYYSKMLIDQGHNPDETGIFYITPCAAKIAAVKSPVGQEDSPITGVINMDFIFNKVYTAVKQGFIGKNTCQLPILDPLKSSGVMWSATNGEAAHMTGRTLAIDEISNVIEFLEQLENEENREIDFLELRACDESCAGGILTSSNRFYTVDRMKKRAARASKKEKEGNYRYANPGPIVQYRDFLEDNISISKVQPRSMDKLDEDISQAMKKMKRVHEIMEMLPYVDCGLCGSPKCSSLAEDIVQGEAEITQCIYVQKRMEQQGVMPAEQSIEIMKRIWGKEKFEISAND